MFCGRRYLDKKKWPEGGWPGGIKYKIIIILLYFDFNFTDNDFCRYNRVYPSIGVYP